MPEFVDLAKRNRNRLDATSQKDLERLIASYGLMSKRLKDKLDLLLLELGEDVNIKKSKRYKDFINALGSEYDKYNTYLQTEIESIVAKSQAQAKLDAAALLSAALLARGITISPKAIAAKQTNVPLKVLAIGSEHYNRLLELAGKQAQYVINALLEGIRLGYGYEKMGKIIVDALGLGLSDALRWARTIQMEAYRETAHNTMLENSNVIDGWTWFAQVDDSTCDGCSEGHGTFHDVSESLNDITPHIWNCRCVELPHVIGDPNPVTGDIIE